MTKIFLLIIIIHNRGWPDIIMDPFSLTQSTVHGYIHNHIQWTGPVKRDINWARKIWLYFSTSLHHNLWYTLEFVPLIDNLIRNCLKVNIPYRSQNIHHCMIRYTLCQLGPFLLALSHIGFSYPLDQLLTLTPNMNTHTHARTHTHTHTHTHAHARTHMHTRAHTHTHTRKHTHVSRLMTQYTHI